MGTAFVGGPYDGMEIDYALVNQHAQVVPVTGALGTRLFALMPPRSSWDALLRGETAATQPRAVYERVFGPDGAHFEATSEALPQAQLEARLRVHPRARTALGALSERDRRAVLKAAAALQGRDPASWPPEVSRPNPEQPVYLLRVSPDLIAFVRTLETGDVELGDIMREETLRLFLERSRAGSPVG